MADEKQKAQLAQKLGKIKIEPNELRKLSLATNQKLMKRKREIKEGSVIV